MKMNFIYVELGKGGQELSFDIKREAKRIFEEKGAPTLWRKNRGSKIFFEKKGELRLFFGAPKFDRKMKIEQRS